jgi:hypothetical protein
MKFIKSKKGLALLAVLAVSVISAVGAYAYFTTSGTGTGTGGVGTSSAVTVSQVGSISDLLPGSAAQAVDFKINNPLSTPQYITQVAVSISSVTAPNADATHPCSASDFAISGSPVAIDQDLASGDTSFSPSGATLAMNDSNSNQDGCKGATVNLAFNAS